MPLGYLALWPVGSPSRRSERGRKGSLGIYSFGFLSVRSPGLAGSLHRRTAFLSRRSSQGGFLYTFLHSKFSILDLVFRTPSYLAVVAALLLLAKDDYAILCDSLTPHSAFVNKSSLNYPNLRVLFPDGTDIDPHWTKSILF